MARRRDVRSERLFRALALSRITFSSIDIFYPDGNYLFLNPQRRLVTLENRDDIADISALACQVFKEEKPRT